MEMDMNKKNEMPNDYNMKKIACYLHLPVSQPVSFGCRDWHVCQFRQLSETSSPGLVLLLQHSQCMQNAYAQELNNFCNVIRHSNVVHGVREEFVRRCCESASARMLFVNNNCAYSFHAIA